MADIRRYIVRQPEVEQCAAARTARMTARKNDSNGNAATAAGNSTPSSVEMAEPASVSASPSGSQSNGGVEMEVDQSPPPPALSSSGATATGSDDVPMVPAAATAAATTATAALVLPAAVPVIPDTPPTPSFPSALLALPLAAAGDAEVEAEGWHGAVPSQWVPIISRDVASTPPQSNGVGSGGPYSDAYISGQPPKRRRLNDDKKPHGSTRDIIADSIKVSFDLIVNCSKSM